jgi:phospholipid transport system substrate-binding protein
MKGAFNMNFIVMAFLVVFPFVAVADTDPAIKGKQAEMFITALEDDAISTLKSTQGNDEARRDEFARILNKNFDMNAIGRFALGRYWTLATPAEQKEYIALFKTMVIDVYTQRFSEYSNQEFLVVGSNPAGARDFVVNSLIKGSGNPIKVDWRVRNGKVIDVIVEGVSMSVTQRNDFAAVIQRNGGQVSSLIDHLKK